MDILSVLTEATLQTARTMTLVFLIVIPLTTVFEVLNRRKVLDKISGRFSRVMKWFNLPGKAAFPLLAGMVMGIVYGSGVLYKCKNEKMLSSRDFMIVCTILLLFHSIIEDTLLFVAVGASILWVFGFRILFGIIFVKILLIIGKVNPRLDFFGKSTRLKHKSRKLH
jgi:hypothetical protein